MIKNKFIYIKNAIKIGNNLLPNFSVGLLNKKENDKTSTACFVWFDEAIEILNDNYDFFDPLKTGDQFLNKVCNVCHRLLPTTKFNKNQNGRNNRTVRRPSCESCRKIIDGVGIRQKEKREWGKNRPELEFFNCPICHKTTIPGLTSKIVLDHDHKDGHIRGWICDSCNTGIGRFKDDVVLLKNAIEFLKTK